MAEISISTKIWKKETFELINYLNPDTEKTKFNINTSGVLRRIQKDIKFIQGEKLPPTPDDLLTITKNVKNGKFYVNCGTWSKDLSKLIDEPGAFLVYRGFSLKEFNKLYNCRYYKLSQGDIFKIGRIYFKVLDINLNKEESISKNNGDSTVRGTMIRNSSCQSIVVNGQKIIQGAYSPKNLNNPCPKIYYNKNVDLNLNQNNNNNNNTLQEKKKSFSQKEINSKSDNNELISVKNKQKPKKVEKAKNKNLKNLLLLKPKNNGKNNATCRICYGDDFTSDNPLICPCKCKGSMKYIHYLCLKNWLNSKIQEDLSIDSNEKDIDIISYNRRDISCELCKQKLPDYIKINGNFYNISFYKPKFDEFIVLESMRVDKDKIKYIHLISFDNKISVNIGRANECELSIAELSVSRFHCMIHKEEGGLYLEDNTSKFGTLVLVQNDNLLLNDFIPLNVQINKTFIKLKVKKPFFLNCCSGLTIQESQKYDYQVQNKKCFDILSYFLIKDNDNASKDNDEEEKINGNNKDIISQPNENNSEKKSIKENIKIENEKNIFAEELGSQSVKSINSHIIKRVLISNKKSIPDFQIKMSEENHKDGFSFVSEKKDKKLNLNNLADNIQIHLLKFKKNNLSNDKSISISKSINNLNPANFKEKEMKIPSINTIKDESKDN